MIIEDDLSICRSLKENIQGTGADVCCMVFASEALDCFMEHEYCLVIIDFQVSGMDGQEMLHIMRAAKHTPILVLTDPLPSDDKAELLRAGANAIIEKPLDLNMCLAQADTLIQLNTDGYNDCQMLTFGTECVIDSTRRQVIVDGEQLTLTRKEFYLLLCLARRPGQVLSRSQLYSQVWSDDLEIGGENAVKVHIGNLRKKLADMGKNYIQTSWGIGYKFVPPEEEKSI